MIGLGVGDVTTANIPSSEAYGEHNPQMEVTVEKSQLLNDSRNWHAVTT